MFDSTTGMIFTYVFLLVVTVIGYAYFSVKENKGNHSAEIGTWMTLFYGFMSRVFMIPLMLLIGVGFLFITNPAVIASLLYN